VFGCQFLAQAGDGEVNDPSADRRAHRVVDRQLLVAHHSLSTRRLSEHTPPLSWW